MRRRERTSDCPAQQLGGANRHGRSRFKLGRGAGGGSPRSLGGTNSTRVDDLTVIGNLIEAVLWFIFAGAFGIMACRARGERRRLWIMLAIAFAVFSASDVIESRTGAWWRPWWLLIMKSSCIVAFMRGVFVYREIRRSEGTQP